MISIRLYNGADKNDVFFVYKSCEDFLALGPEPIASMHMVEEDLRSSVNNNGRFCVISDEDRVVGIVDYISSGYESRFDSAYISLLMIAKNDRSKGIGGAVVRAIEGTVAENPDIKTIRISVQTNNMQAIAFWTNKGYARIGEAQLQPDTTVVYHFQKNI